MTPEIIPASNTELFGMVGTMVLLIILTIVITHFLPEPPDTDEEIDKLLKKEKYWKK